LKEINVLKEKERILPKQYPHNPCWSRLDVVEQNNENDVCAPIVTIRYIHVEYEAPW